MRRFLVAFVAVLVALAFMPAAQAADPTVEILAPAGVQPAGRTITAVVRVRNATNATVTVGAQLAGQTHYLSCGGENVSDDDFSCELFLYYNTRLFVSVDGTEKAARTFRVRPVISSRITNDFVKAGRYAVLAARSVPRIESRKGPETGGSPNCLRHQVQRYRAGAWRTVLTSGCRNVAGDGTVIWKWRGTHPSRVGFRVRAVFPGNAWNAAGPGRWTYFRFR